MLSELCCALVITVLLLIIMKCETANATARSNKPMGEVAPLRTAASMTTETCNHPKNAIQEKVTRRQQTDAIAKPTHLSDEKQSYMEYQSLDDSTVENRALCAELPGELLMEPKSNIVFHAPFLSRQKQCLQIRNPNGRRIGWTLQIETVDLKALQ